jgi:glucan-binding YG repeat protein
MNAPLPKNLWIGGSWTKPVYNGKINLTVDGKGIFDIRIGSNQGNNATGAHAAHINGELNINLKSASAVSLSFQTDPAKIRFGEKAVVQIINSVGAYSETWDTVLKTLQFKPASYYIINNKTKKDISITEYPGEYAFEFDESIQKLVVENADGNEVTYSEGILILPDSGTYTVSLECIKHTYSNDCDDVCDVCEEVDENRGHLFTNYVSNNDATCTEDGTKTATCDREGCEEKDTIADADSMLDHLYDNDCDAKCNVCEAEREVGDHKYSSATDPDCDNCGAKRELGNQFVKEADGKYHYYNNGVHSKVTDLVKIDGKWLYLEKGVWANTVDTLHKINGKWFLIKKGIWTATTGLTEYKGKTFYVVGGKWNSKVNDLKKINGKWYFIKSGKWDSSLESLHKLNGKWFLVKGGMWKATTGLVKYQGKQFYVVGGKWESRTGVYKISGKNYFIKSGKWDKTITTLYKKSGKLLSIKNGMWTKSKAIIKYSGKKYYCDDGYAQTKKTGKVKVSGKTYTVKKGIVK